MRDAVSRSVCNCFRGGVAAILAGFPGGPVSAGLLTHHDLPYAVALTIAQGTVESCAAQGYPVSAVVVDRAGETILAIRGDNAGPHTMENARRKAYTAMSFKTSTTDYAKRFADNNPLVRQQVTLPNVIAIPGGLPIKAGDEVIGGVGVRLAWCGRAMCTGWTGQGHRPVEVGLDQRWQAVRVCPCRRRPACRLVC